MTVRLASYNLHKCLGTDRRRDPARIVGVIADLAADVVALQEVDHRMGPRPAALPKRLIEGGTGLVPLPLAVSEVSLGWHGQTLLVRADARLIAIQRLHLPGLEPRGAVMAEIDLPGSGPLRVVGVHLGLIRLYRQRQLATIRALLGAREAMPTAILGDFNEWSATKGVAPLDGAFTVHAPGLSFHASRPVAALDRVALSGLRLEAAGVLNTPVARRASDHLPVWADVSRA